MHQHKAGRRSSRRTPSDHQPPPGFYEADENDTDTNPHSAINVEGITGRGRDPRLVGGVARARDIEGLAGKTEAESMKVALITTTINVPKVLSRYANLYGSLDDEFLFFVAGDENTDPAAAAYVDNFGIYLDLDKQRQWKTGRLLPTRSITRRNIALLEALKWGADVIVSIDDDNIPMHQDYFMRFIVLFSGPVHGVQVYGDSDWFDAGIWQFPKDSKPVTQRGFPPEKQSCDKITPACDFKIGLAQGVILGDPDTSAKDRMAWHPEVHYVSELLHSGVIVLNKWTPVNTQNTAYARRWAPAMLCCPQFGRCDDIYASLICQCLMYRHGVGVHHGEPFVWQQRNPHDLVKDFHAEEWGMAHMVETADFLNNFVPASNLSITQQVFVIHGLLAQKYQLPGLHELASAWRDDCEKAMA